MAVLTPEELRNEERHNELLRERLELERELGDVSGQQGSASRQASEAAVEGAERSSGAARDLVGGYTGMLEGLTTSTDTAFGGILLTAGEAAKGLRGVFEEATAGAGAYYDFFSKLGEDLRREYFEVQEIFGGAFGEIEEGAEKANKQSAEAVRGITEVYESFYTGIEGTTVSLFELYGSAEEVAQILQDTASESTRAVAFLREDSAGMTQDMALAMKGLGLTQQEASVYIDRALATTGRANTDLLKEVALTVTATQDSTGVSKKIITDNVTGMLENVQNFANMSVQSMSAAGAQLAQYGLDFSALNSLVGQFQSFEGAADSVANLTAVFGVQLDTMDMMMAANEGQEYMLDMVRQGFADAGIGAEDLTSNMAAARTAASQMNLTVDQLQRVLSAEGVQDINEILEGTADAAADAADATTADMVNALDSDMARVQRTLGATHEEMLDMLQGQATMAGWATLQSEAAKTTEEIERMSQTTVEMAGAIQTPIAAVGEAMASELGESLEEALHGAEEGTGGLVGQLEDIAADPIWQELGKMGTGLGGVLGEELGETVTGPLLEAAELMEEVSGEIDLARGKMEDFLDTVREGREGAGVPGETGYVPPWEAMPGFDMEQLGEELGNMLANAGEEGGARFGAEVLGGITDAFTDTETLDEAIDALFDHIHESAVKNGMEAQSASPFGLSIVEGIVTALQESNEEIAQALVDADPIMAAFDEVEALMTQRQDSIVADMAKLSVPVIPAPRLEAQDVDLTVQIDNLNQATDAFVAAATDRPPLNLNVKFELTRQGTGELIAMLEDGDVYGKAVTTAGGTGV